MKLLKTIQFKNLTAEQIARFEKRNAARAIVTDNNDNIDLLHVTKQNYHKLPGGGIEAGEDKITAVHRECLEELGCQIQVTGEIGSIIEFRDKLPLKMKSFCYAAKLKGKKGKPTFNQNEISDGFKIKWTNPQKAAQLMENDTPRDYNGKFIQIRDLTFLKEFLKLQK
ncbi:MAG: NUDIX domain-containing protein [Patescibacteria group bacterium]|jgi:8-oxo-dGTP pyrophosphatase MutT (NUDIX family)